MPANNYKDLTGRRFASLVALAPVKRLGCRSFYWRCVCDCGHELTVHGANLQRRSSKGCGPDCAIVSIRTGHVPPAVRGAAWVALGHGHFCLVDKVDYEKVRKYRWYRSKQGYVATQGLRQETGIRTVLMHRFLLGVTGLSRVDHWDRNPLNNRRRNLRRGTASLNNANSIPKRGRKYKGAYRARKGWRSYIRVNGRQRWLGAFAKEIEAAKAYDKAAKLAFGQFSRTNFGLKKG